MGQVKVKYKGDWIDAEDFQARRAADRAAEPPPQPLDLAALPELKDLDPDMPLAELGDKCPAVRRYVTAEGRMRSGLSPNEQAVARELLQRYGATS